MADCDVSDGTSRRMTFATTTLIQRPAFARAVAARRNSSSALSNARSAIAMASFYDLKAKTLDGDDFDFAQLKGKVTMVTNVASR